MSNRIDDAIALLRALPADPDDSAALARWRELASSIVTEYAEPVDLVAGLSFLGRALVKMLAEASGEPADHVFDLLYRGFIDTDADES